MGRLIEGEAEPGDGTRVLAGGGRSGVAPQLRDLECPDDAPRIAPVDPCGGLRRERLESRHERSEATANEIILELDPEGSVGRQGVRGDAMGDAADVQARAAGEDRE